MNTPVLVVGAGPTGLNLALSLARRNAPFRVISEDSGPGEHSRAMGVHARTLEFYAQFGFADEVVGQGIRTESFQVREAGKDGGREVINVSFKDLGDGLSPYPFVLTYPQDDHERLLLGKLKEAGGDVEWGAKLTGFTEDGDVIIAKVQHQGGRSEEIQACYICGCDGGHSCVRKNLALGFPGGTYDQHFYVADAKIEGSLDRGFHISFGENILALMLPVRSSGMQRLIGLVPTELTERRDLTFEDIRGYVEPLMGVKVREVNWFSTYRVHHRVAERFRVGRAFLAGDAGHIHSPVGGQGMNTGIGDAMNLGWKLAQVLEGRADATLLDSYEPERIGFARWLVDTTDRAFTPLVAGGLRGEITRRILAPLLLGVATRYSLTRHAIFRTVSQTRIHYPESPLSEGHAGHVHGGDQLPWTGVNGEDNFAPLRSLDWQMHVYGEADDQLQQFCRDSNLALHIFGWSDGAKDAGLARDAAYLVRPDGYVGLAMTEGGVARIRSYVERHGLRFGPHRASGAA